MMGAFGPMMFFMLPLAGQGNDLVSLIDAADYFKSRQVEVKVEQMVKLAGTKPEGSADSISQLLAIRWLGENAAETKKAKGREVLQQVADGKIAGDAQGFAKEYAQRALARLDGKPAVLSTIPENSIRTEALAWFPDHVDFVFAADVRSTLKEPLDADNAILGLLRSRLAAREKDMIWNFADTVGNVRVDRLSFGMKLGGAKGNDPEDIYMRFTGLADRARLAKYLFVQAGAKATTEEKGPKGEPITFLDFRDRDPAVALIGDTDLIVAGRSRPMNDGLTFVKDMLEVRAGKKGSVLKGPLAGMMKDVPGSSSFLMAGGLVNEFFDRPLRGFDITLPEQVMISATVGKTVDVRLQGTMAKGEEGKSLVAAIAKLKEQGQAGLKDGALPLKPETTAVFQKALASIKLEADGATVKGTAQVAGDLPKVLRELVGLMTKQLEPRPIEPDLPLKQ